MAKSGLNGSVREFALPRVLGDYRGEKPGPLLVVTGGVHGNEPAGVVAIRRVLAELDERRLPFRGRIVALCGNRAALDLNVRYVTEDLNRMWEDDTVERVKSGGGRNSEEREMAELLFALAEYGASSGLREPHDVSLLDLHSTSARGAPFTVMADTIQNRSLAFALSVPVLLGLEERIDGTLLSHFSESGHVAVCLEGGQNEAPETVENHVAAIWIALVACGNLERADVPELADMEERLSRAARGLPRVVEVRHRHEVAEGDDFVMDPGHVNFDRVTSGEKLASTDGRRVCSPLSGILLMPRYQGQGNDGFFLGGEVSGFWLWLSALIRRVRLPRLMAALPGVRRDDERRRMLIVNPKVTRWLMVEIFHLFGYRRAGMRDGKQLFLRRPDRF